MTQDKVIAGSGRQARQLRLRHPGDRPVRAKFLDRVEGDSADVAARIVQRRSTRIRSHATVESVFSILVIRATGASYIA